MKKIMASVFFLVVLGAANASESTANNCKISKITGLPDSVSKQYARDLFIQAGYRVTAQGDVAAFEFQNDCGFDGGRCVDLTFINRSGKATKPVHVISYNGNERWENLIASAINKLDKCSNR